MKKRKPGGPAPSERRGETPESKTFRRHAEEYPLSIWVDDAARVHLNCICGCSEKAICEALGLTVEDLYPVGHPERPTS